MHFYHNNWDLVAGDLFRALNEFHTGGKLTPLNYSWIIMIPKVAGDSTIGDFRPINLANCVYKIISKVLVNRLKGVVGEMVGNSQATFIKGRSILNSVTVAEFISHLREDNEGLLVKVDFNKTFDTLDWVFFCPAWSQGIQSEI